MKLISTRNKNVEMNYSEGIIKGIADDNGLFVPQSFPTIDIKTLVDDDYQTIAFKILYHYLKDEFEADQLNNIIAKAYDDKFSNPSIAPMTTYGQLHFIELFHGPTLAFKDMALSILPYLLTASKVIADLDEKIVILTATSGDTGKAALEGFSDVKDTEIIVFYPKDGVSPIQKQQMITQAGENTHVFGIDGNFDQAQSAVKEIFTDQDFKATLKTNDYIFSSANSINIGRLLPQIVYYFHAYMQLVRQGTIALGEAINIVVPTGNFGNILAAKYANTMGLPVNRFVCASNKNNILTDFINTGIYDLNREFMQTLSPSMDILISSNLERLLFHISNQDDQLVNQLMDDLKTDGRYEVTPTMKENLNQFYGNFCTDEETLQTIKTVFDDWDYLIDPHTAVAVKVYEKYKQDNPKDQHHTLLASTASPYKFPGSIADALSIDASGIDDFQLIEKINALTQVKIPKNIASLVSKDQRHQQSIAVDEMRSIILKALTID